MRVTLFSLRFGNDIFGFDGFLNGEKVFTAKVSVGVHTISKNFIFLHAKAFFTLT
jgi:hypothetical protein